MKKHEQGFELYKKSNGKMSNVDIANELGVLDSTVRKWKSRYKWDDQLGIKKTVSPTKKGSVTVKKREDQKQKTINALVQADIYSPALDLLIDVYLDCWELYIKSNKQDEKLRKELARLLNQLGLDNKSLLSKGNRIPKNKEKEKPKEETQENNKLLQFRQRMLK